MRHDASAVAPPLRGIRVIEITTAWAGPMLGRVLADFGAEVIKVESLGALDNWRGAVRGDDRKRYPDGEPGERPYNRNAWFNTQNLGKRSLGLDLKAPDARPLMRQLVAGADVLISNFAAGALARLGLAYEDLVRIRPDIVLIEMGVAGRGGALEGCRGVGPTMEAMAGMTPLTGYGDGVPQRTGPAYVDPIGALSGAMAAMLALFHRRRTGEGQRVELAQRESLLHWYGERVLLQAERGRGVRPQGNALPWACPHDAYRAAGEDQWVAIAVFDENDWQALAHAMGRPELLRDDRFLDVARRFEHAEALRESIEAWSRGLDKREAAARLQARGVCAAPVCSGADVYHDPQLAAMGFLPEVSHPEAGTHRYQELPFRGAGGGRSSSRPAPLLGQDTDDILAGLLGLDAPARQALYKAGVASCAPSPGAPGALTEEGGRHAL